MAQQKALRDWLYLFIIGTQLFGMLGKNLIVPYIYIHAPKCSQFNSQLWISSPSIPNLSTSPPHLPFTSFSLYANSTSPPPATPSSLTTPTSHGSKSSSTLRASSNSHWRHISSLSWLLKEPRRDLLNWPDWHLDRSPSWGLRRAVLSCFTWATTW
jgi:hypothetical protein